MAATGECRCPECEAIKRAIVEMAERARLRRVAHLAKRGAV